MAAPNPAGKRGQSPHAKHKKLLIVLVPVLIAVMVFTVPRTVKQLRGDGEAATAPASASQTPASGTNGGAAGSPTAPAADPAAVAASAKAILEDTDSHPEASEGQLISFSRFDSRDPFVQLVEDEAPDTSATDPSGAVPVDPTAPATTSPTTPTTTVPTDSSTDTDTDTTPVTKVKISVNGTAHVLGVGDAFPGADPAFRVVAIGDDSIEIALVSGTFSTGVNTITVRVGDPVTLISQPDGARYTIKLLGPA